MTPLSAETQPVPADDMDEWPGWPPGLSPETLHELNRTRTTIESIYKEANKSAASNLSRHRWTAGCIATFGTYAVLMGILQLYIPGFAGPVVAEIICAGIGATAVLIGIFSGFMWNWLVQRHRAERCRFLKFNFLLDVALAGRESGWLLHVTGQFQEEARKLKELEEDGMEEWLKGEKILPEAPPVTENETVSSDLRVLAEHYLNTRLAVQSHYLSKQSQRDERRGSRTRDVATLLFAASILLIFIHFVLFRVEEHWRALEHPSVLVEDRLRMLEKVSSYLVWLAAAFPVIGAGLRSARNISEYSRNALRFTSKYNALKGVIEDLDKALAGQPRAEQVARLLWKGEQILEGEHREWLRLMIETEWIG